MTTKKKALYISQEVTPYLRESFQGHICQELPARVQENGYEARTFMPKYGCINERRNQLHEVIRLSGLNIPVDDADHPLIIKVATLQSSKMQVYFIDNDDYFQHHAVTDLEIRETPDDNDERVIFFTRGVMETVKKLRWEPAVIHCSGWVTALAPLYLKKAYNEDPTVGKAKVVYSIFNDPFDGTLDQRSAKTRHSTDSMPKPQRLSATPPPTGSLSTAWQSTTPTAWWQLRRTCPPNSLNTHASKEKKCWNSSPTPTRTPPP